MKSNIIIIGGLLLFVAIVVATLRPARLQAEDTWITRHGVVTEMYKTVFNDLAVKLHGQSNIYYINGALEAATLSEWKQKLMNKNVVIRYAEKWTPIKHEGEQHFVGSLAYEGQVLYDDETKKK